MKLNDIYDGSQTPFQGDRILALRNIPANARILRATVRVTPVDATNGSNPFAETIRFNGAVGDFGATKTAVADQWVEVDFHGRRTLSRVNGANLTDTTLQVDLGGAYMDVNANGAIRAPEDLFYKLPGNSAALPSLAVIKLKITNSTDPPVRPPVTPRGNDPDVAEVIIRSAPTNVSLRLGQTPPFWIHLGEMLSPETTPDYAEVLQAFLADAEVENGFYVTSLTLHSDSIARLKLETEIEFAVEQKALAAGVSEVKLEYDLSGFPKTQPDQLKIAVPAGARVSSRGTSARVIGAFDSTRVVFNPMETVSPDGVVRAVSPSGTLAVAPGSSPAQPIELPIELVEALSATAVDLLLSVTRTSRLRLDLREDLDGKPGDASLLPEPVNFEAPGPVGQERDLDEEKRRKWLSVALPAEFQFQPKRRYWLLLQSLEGEAAWSVAPATAGSVGMQRTEDGGLSWRAATAAKISGPLAAFFRLRKVNERFRMPIALQVGVGDFPVRVNLDRFEPLGRVDLALDVDVANALNTHLGKAATRDCPVTEHLVNGDFEQWLPVSEDMVQQAIRNEVAQQKIVTSGAGLRAIGLAPDGSLVYVAGSAINNQGFLQIIDATCGESIKKFELPGFTQNALVVSPDGRRVYAADSVRLLAVDTNTREVSGNPVPLSGAFKRALAVSPDGGQLYVTEYFYSTGNNEGWVRVIDTELLEQVIQGRLTLDKATLARLPFGLGQEPTSLAVAPDGNRLYVVIVNHNQNDQGAVHIFDTATGQQIGSAVPVGRQAGGIALTPDGKLAIVANAGENTVSVVDTTTRTAGAPINIGQPPIAVIISPGGALAYVAYGGASKIRVLDLTRLVFVKDFTVDSAQNSFPVALALAPQGDRVYVASAIPNSLGGSLTSIQLGRRRPAEWELTSGQVALKCLQKPNSQPVEFFRIAELGRLSETATAPNSLSQVAPVAAGCAYEFSFMAIANQPDAVAEIIWLNGQCGLTKTDQIPIVVSAAALSATTPALAFHRARLTAPAGADQAEVRFIVPAGGLAFIDSVSLMGTDETVANGDFKSESEGRLAGWTVSPAVAPGFSVIASADGVKLQNAGANAVTLKQTIPAKGGQPFTLEFQGRTTKLSANQTGSQTNARIEARWLDTSGSVIGAPVALEIFADNFGASVANGASPANAVQAEISLVIPPGTVLQAQGVSMRSNPATQIPLTFVAQSPGELVITDLQVSFEEAEVAPPPIPERGLCQATPPGRAPGETPHDCCFCPDCGDERTMIEAETRLTRAGRPVSVGFCSECGLELAHFGGRATGAGSAMFPGATAAQPVVIRASAVAARAPLIQPPQLIANGAHRPPTDVAGAGEATVTPRTRKRSRGRPLTDVEGITEAIARQFEEIGINSVRALADASPDTLAQLKGLPMSKVNQYVAIAKRLLRSKRKDRSTGRPG